jgi:hypothetical protein
LGEQYKNILQQFSVTNYHISYFVIALFLLLVNLRGSIAQVKKYPYLTLFGVLFFLVYLAAFVWYSPISPERRFTNALFLPWMFSLFVSLREIAQNQIPPINPERAIDARLFTRAAHLLISLTLIFNIWLVLNERIFFDRFGS